MAAELRERRADSRVVRRIGVYLRDEPSDGRARTSRCGTSPAAIAGRRRDIHADEENMRELGKGEPSRVVDCPHLSPGR
jgi:hypothetical protein